MCRFATKNIVTTLIISFVFMCKTQSQENVLIDFPPTGFVSSKSFTPYKDTMFISHNESRTTLYQVVDAISLNIPAPSGICFDGNLFWIPNYAAASGNQLIYEFDIKKSQIVDSIPSPSLWATGMAWDGSSIWLKGSYQSFGSSLIKITRTGQVETFFNSVYSCYWGGIAWDGTNLYYGINTCGVSDSREKSMIYKFIPQNGNIIDSIPPPSGNINGLVFDKSSFWYCDAKTLRIYKMTTNGEMIDSFPTPGSLPSGLTIARGYLWNVDIGSNMLYKIDIGLTPPIPHIVKIESRYATAMITWQNVLSDTTTVKFLIYRSELNNPATAVCVDSVLPAISTL
ncbi:MAG TPA: hypothetical protein VNJ29_01095, partial [Candidatus Nitrosotenuis sp.]|nr:hypothetical protein [Candidatus Nitrosotenuis sp.]